MRLMTWRGISARPYPGGPSKAIEPGFNFKDVRLEGGGWMRTTHATAMRDFYRVLAVCHTVIPEGEPTPDTICYQAGAPAATLLHFSPQPHPCLSRH